MKRFYIESGILVYEWPIFEQAILSGTHGFIFSKEQWKNRKLTKDGEQGRTQLSANERIAMIDVLNKLRSSGAIPSPEELKQKLEKGLKI